MVASRHIPSKQPSWEVQTNDLRELLAGSVGQNPEAVAITGPDGEFTYAQLDALADWMAWALADLGVSRGDRVGIWMDKSGRAVAAMQGALRLGAAYVPLDPLAPPLRIQEIISDCAMRAVVTVADRDEMLAGSSEDLARLVVGEAEHETRVPRFAAVPVDTDDLAYILYTSGSTGKPKGVCVSHRNALAFIEWAAREIAATADDRLSNHAPFHFDLSVLDLYVAFSSGASVHLVPDGMSYVPSRLVDFIVDNGITIWYSVPSALTLMMEQGRLLESAQMPVRAFLFAGEPFPIKNLRRLVSRWPKARYLNLYGPAETNVCTFYEVEEIDPDRTAPVPIGKACSGDEVWAVKSDGTPALAGEEGELMVAGPTVLVGYWGRDPHGDNPYPTGDIVRLEADGNYAFIGRRDHMVKVRGHRIELGDIEDALDQYPGMREVAVTVTGSAIDAKLVAFAVYTGERRPTLLDIKRHCAERLPRYMIVDQIRFLDVMPLSRNGKMDRIELGRQVSDQIAEVKP